MTTTILGILDGRFDPNAALFRDGELLSLGEEERFSRNKHAVGEFPLQSVKFCLQEADISFADIDRIAYPWDGTKYPLYMAQFFLDGWLEYDKDSRTLEWEKENLEKFRAGQIRDRLQDGLSEEFSDDLPPIDFFNHHRCHAASAYYYSGFDSGAILTADGSGEECAVVGWQASTDGKIEKVFSYDIPNSLGWFYAAITAYLGFRPYNGEGKVMGLAAYGESDSDVEGVIHDILSVTDHDFSLDPSYIFYGKRSYHDRFTDKLVSRLGEPRKQGEDITDFHKNVAYAAQKRFEAALLACARRLLRETGEVSLCLAGGVMYNCKANKVLREKLDIEQFFVQPIAGEQGATVGSGLLAQDRTHSEPMTDVYYGWNPTESDIEQAISQSTIDLVIESREDTRSRVASLLSDGNIVGRYDGPMECGPRALGNRSILADPREKKMLEAVNEVKERENWRPFAPTILAEYGTDVLDVSASEHISLDSFMIQTYDVNEDWLDRIPAAVHVDGTTRPQVLSQENNEHYWMLLTEFNEKTGVPALLNTSFNLSGDPIVRTPKEAIKTYRNSKIDYLQLGPYLVS